MLSIYFTKIKSVLFSFNIYSSKTSVNIFKFCSTDQYWQSIKTMHMQYLLPYILYSPSTNLNSNNLYNFIVLKLTTMNFNISNKIESLNSLSIKGRSHCTR